MRRFKFTTETPTKGPHSQPLKIPLASGALAEREWLPIRGSSMKKIVGNGVSTRNRYSLLFALILLVAVALAAGSLWVMWLNAGTTVRLLKHRSLRAPAFLVRLSQEQELKALTNAAEAGDPVAQYKLYESVP